MEPGDWNRTQRVDIGDGRIDRMSRGVWAVVPIGDDLELIDALEEGRDDLVGRVDPAVTAEIEEAGQQPEARPADVGRGAGAFGLALEFGQTIATIGGAAAAVKGTVLGVRSTYRRLARRIGKLPLVSLGAAEHLAAADLIDRQQTQTTMLVGSGDGTSNSSDRAFTGADAFWVILSDGEKRLHHYQVDAYGRVTYIGTGPPAPRYEDPDPDPDIGPSCIHLFA